MNLDRVEKYLEGHVKNTTFISGFISATMFGPPMSKDQVPTYRMAVRLVPQAVRFFKITHDENLSFEETSTRSQDVRVTSALVLRLILAASTKKIDIKGLLNTLLRYVEDRKRSAETTFHSYLFPIVTGVCGYIAREDRPATADERSFIVEG